MLNRRMMAAMLILSFMLTGCDLMTETHWLIKPDESSDGSSSRAMDWTFTS